MKIVNRVDNTELKLPSISALVASGVSIKNAQQRHYRAVLRAVYSPILYPIYSTKMSEFLEKYKDEKLVPYKMTESDKKKLKNNPDYIEDIPRYYVPGYDKAVSNWKLDGILAQEFYSRFMNNDPTLVHVTNLWNETYKLVLD